MKRYLAIIFPLFFVLLFLASCEEDIVPDWTHYYTETQCADPWGMDKDDAVLKENITTYLAQHDIEVLHIGIFPENVGDITCLACSCASGRIIKVVVNESDGQKLLDLLVEDYQKWTAY